MAQIQLKITNYKLKNDNIIILTAQSRKKKFTIKTFHNSYPQTYKDLNSLNIGDEVYLEGKFVKNKSNRYRDFVVSKVISIPNSIGSQV